MVTARYLGFGIPIVHLEPGNFVAGVSARQGFLIVLRRCDILSAIIAESILGVHQLVSERAGDHDGR